MTITEYQDKILLYIENIKTLYFFVRLKNKVFLYCNNCKKNNSHRGKNFITIKNAKNFRKMVFLNVLVIVLVQQKTTSLVSEMLINLPKLRKIILIEKKKVYLKKTQKNDEQILDELNLKFCSKKKYLSFKNLKSHSFQWGTKILILRRLIVPTLNLPKPRKTIKFLLHKYNKKFGVIFKSTFFFISTNSLFYFKSSNDPSISLLRRDFEENFQRIADEMGVLALKFNSFKSRDILYTVSSLSRD